MPGVPCAARAGLRIMRPDLPKVASETAMQPRERVPLGDRRSAEADACRMAPASRSGRSSTSRNGRSTGRCRAPCCRRRWASRCCPTCRTGPGTNTACGSASGACSRCCADFGMTPTLAINGYVCNGYPRSPRRRSPPAGSSWATALCRGRCTGWRTSGRDPRHDRGDRELHRHSTARLGEPGPDRDRRDARTCCARRASSTSPTGARRPAGR